MLKIVNGQSSSISFSPLRSFFTDPALRLVPFLLKTELGLKVSVKFEDDGGLNSFVSSLCDDSASPITFAIVLMVWVGHENDLECIETFSISVCFLLVYPFSVKNPPSGFTSWNGGAEYKLVKFTSGSLYIREKATSAVPITADHQ